LEFDRIILPGAEILPLSTKIIAAPHLKTDKDGRIHGKGHPKRDALGWMIPVLWPIKIITLPMRGPYPTLKGESRLTMRLMEDVTVPAIQARASVPAPPWVTPGSYTPAKYGLLRPASAVTRDVVAPTAGVNASPAAEPASVALPAVQATREDHSTLIILKGGSAFVAREYWVQGSQLHCVSESGEQKELPLDSVDLYQTVRLNRERNVEFELHTKDLREQ
jgi:hypothetical protein